MARIKRAVMTRKRRNKVLKSAKGYWGAKSKHFKMAKQAVMKSGNYAFVGRKLKKRDFRRLWITRISAQAKICGMNYSTLMHGLKPVSYTHLDVYKRQVHKVHVEMSLGQLVAQKPVGTRNRNFDPY